MVSRQHAKNRREKGAFLAVPRVVIESKHYMRLSHLAIRLLFDLYVQYRGNNNGDLCAAWPIMKARGWRSSCSLFKAKQELIRTGFIKVTRMGDRRRPNLYALTFLAIDECQGKLDCASTTTPPGDWKLDRVTLIESNSDSHRELYPDSQDSYHSL